MTENFPRVILSYGACFISGFLVATWCLPLMNRKPRSQIPQNRAGFSIYLPLVSSSSQSTLIDLKGKRMKILKSIDRSLEPCVLETPPITFSMRDNFAIISGALESLENFAISVTALDLKNLNFIDFNSPEIYQNCRAYPRVYYGD